MFTFPLFSGDFGLGFATEFIVITTHEYIIAVAWGERETVGLNLARYSVKLSGGFGARIGANPKLYPRYESLTASHSSSVSSQLLGSFCDKAFFTPA